MPIQEKEKDFSPADESHQVSQVAEVTAVPNFPVSPLYSVFLKCEAAYAMLLKSSLAIFSILLGGLMFGQVLMRYVFNSPFLGIEEIAEGVQNFVSVWSL
ncbi:hypothetical protein [Halomonas citrativorans]|uniref:Uncharacterized protein n=1 Tax=Halomonas citrativorans TaxID=2742612 RepID=A0ABR9FEP2_9GAMM|nr:hypothetical protein [Halomonas citrativorans]MBE0404967.1 hypothetical protein [Halomonas citrativorans]